MVGAASHHRHPPRPVIIILLLHIFTKLLQKHLFPETILGFWRLACLNAVSTVPGHVFGETAAIPPLELVSDLIDSGSEAAGEFLHPQFVQHLDQSAEWWVWVWGSRLTGLASARYDRPAP